MTGRAFNRSADQMWALVPGWTRYRDERDAGGLLRGLVEALGVGVDAVRDDVLRLLDDMFVETCDERLIGLVGDLVGVSIDPRVPVNRQRHQVKYALHLRRRKGTVAQLEALGWQLTGFPTRVSEAPSTQRTVRDPTFAARVSSPPPDAASAPPAAGIPPPGALRPDGPLRGPFASNISGRVPLGRLRFELDAAWPVRRTQVELERLRADVHAVDDKRAVGLRRANGTPIFVRDDPSELVGPGRAIEVTPVGADLERLGRLVPRFMNLAGDAPVYVPDHTLAIDPERGRVAGPTAPMPGIRAYRHYRLSFWEPLGAEAITHDAPAALGQGAFAFAPDGGLEGLSDAEGVRLRLALEGERNVPVPTCRERLLVVREPGRGHRPTHHLPFVLLRPGVPLRDDEPAEHQGLPLDGPGLNLLFSIEDEWGWDRFRHVRLTADFGREPPPDDSVEVDVDRGRFRVGPAHERAALRVRYHRPYDLATIKRRALDALLGALPLGRSATFVFRDTAPGCTEVTSP
jgi:hypothetical protein